MKTVRDILIEWLKVHHYDGLCMTGCWCSLNDLAPCWTYPMDCYPAYRRVATKDDPESGIKKGEVYYSTKPRPAARGKNV